MLDPMISPYRKMVRECKEANVSGEDFDIMCQILTRMEDLAQKHDDMTAFSMEMLKEDLYLKFSTHYTNVLIKSSQSSGSDDNSDAMLLKRYLDALRDTIKKIKEEKQKTIEMARSFDAKANASSQIDYLKQHSKIKLSDSLIKYKKEEAFKEIDEELKDKPNMHKNDVEVDKMFRDDLLVAPIEKAIALGEEPGMTYPRFLRLLIEKGLDKLMEEGHTAVRAGMAFRLRIAEALGKGTIATEMEHKKLEAFDKLAELSELKIPNPDELKITLERIERQYKPQIAKHGNIEDRWDDIIDDMYIWSLSYVSFAKEIQPWAMYPFEERPEMIRETQKTSPGIIKVRLKQLKKYYDMDFYDIFKHITFKLSVELYGVKYSQEMIEFLIDKVYPECRPFNDLPQDAISIQERLYKEKKIYNPESHLPAEKIMKCYDAEYGEGRYATKFPLPIKGDSTAAPWDWDSFSNR